MAGGVLKGFGVVLIVLGSLGVLAGIVAAAFGAYVYNEEENQGVFADRDEAEQGAMIAVAGLFAAGAGLVLLLLGVLLYALGAGRARRELMRAVSASRADSPAAVLAPAHAPAPAAPARGSGARTAWVVLAAAGALALGVLVMLLFFQPGGPLSDDDGQRDRAPESQTFTGTIQGLSTPPLGPSTVSDATHSMQTSVRSGLVRGSLNWTAGPTAPASLLLVLEVKSGDDWAEVARGEGGSGLTVEAPRTPLEGSVRARIFPAGTGGGSADYELTLTVVPGA